MYTRRLQLVCGEDLNGLELWRRLYADHEGGAEQAILAKMQRLRSFPKCPSKTRPGAYLGKWDTLRNQYGADLPDYTAYAMLLNMVPDDVATELRDQTNWISTTELATDYLRNERSRYANRHLASIHEKVDDAQLQSDPKTPINALFEQQTQYMKEMQTMMDSLCARFRSQPPPRRQQTAPTGSGGRGGGGG